MLEKTFKLILIEWKKKNLIFFVIIYLDNILINIKNSIQEHFDIV